MANISELCLVQTKKLKYVGKWLKWWGYSKAVLLKV
ncbi:hypothetical protein T09_4917 [Trichinella sp. T9]|nr:hypothetical protein T09_4917 [Trichinella sp. T9]